LTLTDISPRSGVGAQRRKSAMGALGAGMDKMAVTK
jgi:hypothetical protein